MKFNKHFLLSTAIICSIVLSCPLTTSAKYQENYEADLYKEQVASVEVFNNKSVYLTNEDLFLMAQVVYAESRSEPYEGKVAVASVILNRLKSPQFPKTIKGVVLQKQAFSCVKGGKINIEPDTTCYSAVIEALSGNDPSNNALFFYNPEIATSQWMKSVQKQNVKAIGNHVFFGVND